MHAREGGRERSWRATQKLKGRKNEIGDDKSMAQMTKQSPASERNAGRLIQLRHLLFARF
jgi:hypothetical protein